MWQTRFEGPMADAARLYRAFLPAGITPAEVDAMTPSHIAALLRLDELDAREGEELVQPRASHAVTHEPPDIDRTLTRRQRRELAAQDPATAWRDDEGQPYGPEGAQGAPLSRQERRRAAEARGEPWGGEEPSPRS